ncbi:hypothetical protein ACQ4PT_064234 [Festuca glaucescens]
MTGLPNGQLQVKYYCDYKLEAEISERLFPGKTSRPKVSEIGKMLEEYQEADDSFRELWLLFLVSTVVAPTTDVKMSNKCYPMLLWYFDALNTNHLELMLGDERFPINAWSSLQIDAVGAMDAQEYDSTIFGVLELKDEYKEDIAREIGLNGLLSNLVQGMTESADTDTENEDDVEHASDEENVDLSASESEENEEMSPTVVTRREASTSLSPPPMHSQIAVSTYSDLDRSEAEGNIADVSGFTPDSPSESTEQADERIRGSAAVLASSLGLIKKSRISTASVSGLNELVKNIVAEELGIHVDKDGESESVALNNATSELVKVSESIALNIATSELEKKSEPVDLNNATTEQEHHGFETRIERERLHHQLDSSALNVAAGSKYVLSQDISVSSEGLISENDFVPLNVVVAQDIPVLPSGVVLQDLPADEKVDNDVVKDNRLKKRKRLALPTTVPARKSPRLARMRDESIPQCSDLSLKTKNVTKSSVRTKSATKEDGKSCSSAFVVVSPTVSTNCLESIVGDGKTVASAIPISPSATKSQTVKDGNSKDSAIPISPTIVDAQTPKPSAATNTCRSIVVSPAQQQHHHLPSDFSGSKCKISPLVHANLGGSGLEHHPPVRVSEDIIHAVRNLSESVKKSGILSRFVGLDNITATRPLRKRKPVDKGTSSSGEKKYSHPGMFTPPSFDLGFNPQETSTSGSELDIICSDEDAVPEFALNVAPLSWSNSEAEPAGNTSSDVDFEEFTLSEEVQQVMAGNISQLSEKGVKELAKYEKASKAFLERQRALKSAAEPTVTQHGKFIQSVTPKVQPHKARVKKSSHFMQSPFDSAIKVTAEEEEIYQLIMLSNKHQRPVKSNIRKYQIIKYQDSWAHTSDLADSIHGRGELSNHCMEVGIEYLWRTNTVEGKVIVPFQTSLFLMNGEFEKKAVVSLFKRTSNYSLSVMKQVTFVVFQEISRGNKEGNHWYSLSLNIQAGRFEVLDSMRGESSESLMNHASNLVSRIKSIWKVHYSTSKIQIENWEIKVIDVPIQETNFDCGFHALYNVEKWDGQNIPLLGKGDVSKLRRVMPYRWLTADFNEEKDN